MTAVDPIDGATDVPTNTATIAAAFSEPIATPAGDASMVVTCLAPCSSPAGTVLLSGTGTVATFELSSTTGLEPSRIYTGTITGVRSLATGLTLARPYVWHFTTGTAPDTESPTVRSTSPLAGAGGVTPNIQLAASFSEPMDPLTVTTASFTLACPDGVHVAGNVGFAVSGDVATFAPTSGLPAGTTCTASITTGVMDVAHNPMAAPVAWTFTTGTAPDVTVPTVSSTSPLAGAAAVAFNASISASFSEPMDPLTITTATFELACPAGTPVSGSVGFAFNGSVATFTPLNELPASTECLASIDAAVRDAAGNAMPIPFAWSFTTGVAPDISAPTVSSTSPLASASGVAINTAITAGFSEAMDPLSITTATFEVACPAGMPVSGTVAYAVSGNVAAFIPTAGLPPSTNCTARVTSAAKDVAGNDMAAPYDWSFTTGTAPDATVPTVSSTSPLAGAAAVAFNASISASFSEPMDPLTITTATFEVACPAGTPVSGTVGYAVSGNVATLIPTAGLPPGTSCTARVTSAAKDVAGNAMPIPFAWSFTTGVAPDISAPTVSSTSPLASASGVAINTAITAGFSEAMDPLSITTATFEVACPAGMPVSGTVAYAVSGNVAAFIPTAGLPTSTNCTARVTSAAKDVAGNDMAALYDWSFTTGVAPDVTAPSVSAANPADLAVGVCTNKTINVSFSEPMDPLTITTATFTLSISAGASLAGVVAYDELANIATFEPTAALVGTPATDYVATLKGGASGAKDLAGNAIAVDVVTRFTSNAATCTTARALGPAAPFGAFGGSASLTNDGLATVVNGDIGVDAASTAVTGLRDSGGNVYTITPNNDGRVNGLIYTLTAPPGSVAGDVAFQARAAAVAAFDSLSPGNLPGGIDVSSAVQCPSCGGVGDGADELAGRTLPPGIYRSATGTYDIGGAGRTSAGLVLDAGGDANAVWVFQTAAGTGTLNVGLTGPTTPAVPIEVLLINGAQPKNVFWYVPAGAVIGTGSTVSGTILSHAAITISTTGGSPPTAVVTTINGRIIALTAAVTMTNTVINIPAP